MQIDKITINNFRVYKGVNTITLSVDDQRNVAIITGNNGYGKTSFLTSLVWCLYGKLMIDVEEKYRKEVYANGGYKNYCKNLLNRSSWQEFSNTETSNALNENAIFSVSISFKKIFIPVIPCEKLEIVRTYNVKSNTENLAIYIDGNINELTKEVGPEIFINDFILRKEIAKFFFFDAEKIVELAEIKNIEDKRNLSIAYTEVLGIKKYLDLKNDLENLRLRISKKNAKGLDKVKLDDLLKRHEQNQKIIEHQNIFLKEKEDELVLKKLASDKFQERLIREGSSITLEDMKDFKVLRTQLSQENLKTKSKMKELMELAPLAIVSSLIKRVEEQLIEEQTDKDITSSDSLLKRKAISLKSAISKSSLSLGDKKKELLFDLIEKSLLPNGVGIFKPLLDYSPEQENRFFSIVDNLRNSFNKAFKSTSSELKIQQTSILTLNRKLSDAESKENDAVIKAIRIDKIELDSSIEKIENEIIELKAKNIALITEQNTFAIQISELNKRVSIEEQDKAKDEAAANIIRDLEKFIYKLKLKKKNSLENKITLELNILMHKRNFIKKVDVVIEGDLIDIELYDNNFVKINKDSLSKGEQQLYATALLKALVDESNIHFPVFIDSPLQKFDKEHAKNIIQDFYPNVSSQVILLPLLEKELNHQEFELLRDRISNCYFIKNTDKYQSVFKEVMAENLYSEFQEV